MIRLLLDLGDPAPPRARVEGERFHYLSRVLRLAPGDSLEVFDGRGHLWPARVDTVAADHAVLSLGERRTAPQAAPITLIQGHPKGEKLEWILQKATELGAARIVVADTERAVVKLPPSKAPARLERWRRIAEEASRQCGGARVPQVDGPLALGEAVRALPAGTLCLVLDEEEHARTLSSALLAAPPGSALALVVGPEGGLSREEVSALTAAGAVPVTLGARVLRTETAPLAALAIALHLSGELG